MILAKEFCSAKFQSKIKLHASYIFLWKFIFFLIKNLIIHLIKKINIKIGLM